MTMPWYRITAPLTGDEERGLWEGADGDEAIRAFKRAAGRNRPHLIIATPATEPPRTRGDRP
jgi:hypothetical protein